MQFEKQLENKSGEDGFPKLVRDGIPDLIEKRTGKRPETIIMGKEEYQKQLIKKIAEEALELEEAFGDRKHTIEELADITELILTILREQNISLEEVEATRLGKAKERGGFDKRILMLKNV